MNGNLHFFSPTYRRFIALIGRSFIQYCQGRTVEVWTGPAHARVDRLLRYIFLVEPQANREVVGLTAQTPNLACLVLENVLWRQPPLRQKRFMAVILGFNAYPNRWATVALRAASIAVAYQAFQMLFEKNLWGFLVKLIVFILYLLNYFLELRYIVGSF